MALLPPPELRRRYLINPLYLHIQGEVNVRIVVLRFIEVSYGAAVSEYVCLPIRSHRDYMSAHQYDALHKP